ncbi:MAG: nuclear transport factor 2 family protein [Acidiferrobacter sp.]
MASRESHQRLRILEERLLSRVSDGSDPSLTTLLAEDFCEVGCSGRLYDKTETISRLATHIGRHFSITDFQIRFLAPDVALLIYLLIVTEDPDTTRSSWRSSLWQCHHGRWQIHFHQGTPVPDLAKDLTSFLP